MPQLSLDLIEQLAIVHDDDLVPFAQSASATDLLGEIVASPPAVEPEEATSESVVRQEFARRGNPGVRRVRGSAVWRIAAMFLVLLGITIGAVIGISGGHQTLFPTGAGPTGTQPRTPTPTPTPSKWILTSVIKQETLTEGQISPQPASMLSCATSSQCYAVSNPPVTRFASAPDYLMGFGSGTLDVSSDGGNSWRAVPLPTGVALTTPLSCYGADDCVAGAVVLGDATSLAALAPANAGAVVRDLVGPDGPVSANGSCNLDALQGGPSVSQSLAVLEDFGSVVAATSPTSKSTTSEMQCANSISFSVTHALGQLVSPGPAEGLSPLAAGGVPKGGQLTTLQRELDSMSLYRADGATAVIESTSDGGQSWSAVPLPADTGTLIALSCPSNTSCAALARRNTALSPGDPLPWTTSVPFVDFEPVVFLQTTDDGASWTSSNLPRSDDEPVALSCTTPSSCTAVGATGSGDQSAAHHGLVLQTDDGGTTWTSAWLPSNATEIRGFSCPTSSSCFAVGNALVPNPQPCPATSGPLPPSYGGACDRGATAEEDVALTSDDGGASWTLLTLPAALSATEPLNMSLTSVSCTTATQCAFSGNVGFSGFGANGTGQTWVSGPDGTMFNATNGPGSGPAMVASTADAGSSWTVTTFGWKEATGNQLLETTQVLCQSADVCLAIGGSSSFDTPVFVGP